MRWSKIAPKKEPEVSNHKKVTEREMKERAGRMLEKAVGGSGIEVENDIVLSAKTGELVEEIPPRPRAREMMREGEALAYCP